MVFRIVCTIPSPHKCNEEGPILSMSSPASLVNRNDNIGIGCSGRPTPTTTTTPDPAPSAAKRYGYPVTMTMIAALGVVLVNNLHDGCIVVHNIIHFKTIDDTRVAAIIDTIAIIVGVGTIQSCSCCC